MTDMPVNYTRDTRISQERMVRSLTRKLDCCPGCGRYILDYDTDGTESPSGQRWCLIDALSTGAFTREHGWDENFFDRVRADAQREMQRLNEDEPDFKSFDPELEALLMEEEEIAQRRETCYCDPNDHDCGTP